MLELVDTTGSLRQGWRSSKVFQRHSMSEM